jgi:hypothetical protein
MTGQRTQTDGNHLHGKILEASDIEGLSTITASGEKGTSSCSSPSVTRLVADFTDSLMTKRHFALLFNDMFRDFSIRILSLIPGVTLNGRQRI